MTIKSLISITLVALATSLSQPAISADEWQFEATPYIWASGLDGTIGVKGVDADIDVSFNELEKKLETAFFGLFTARKDRWTYGLDIMYTKLEDEGSKSVSGPLGKVEINGALKLSAEMDVYQGTVAYNISDSDTRIDLLGALRYTKIESKLELGVTTPGPIFAGADVSASGSVDWTDLVVGVSLEHPLTANVVLVGYADVGGSSDDDTYQLLAGVNWEFHKDWIAKAGYREISWDYKKDGVTWDIRQSGAYMGLGIRF